MFPDDNKTEGRQVVVEPKKPMQTRPKQYVLMTADMSIKGHSKAKVGTVIRVSPEEALPYVSSKTLIPIDIAIKEGIYPPKKDTLVEKLKKATQESQDRPVAQNLQQATSSKEDEKKSFLGNKLREAIQQRKEETTESKASPTILPADKLAAIQSGGQPAPDKDEN